MSKSSLIYLSFVKEKNLTKVVQKEIDINKKYEFPKNLKIINYVSKILVISVETGNWIVLENQNQLDFFHLLENKKVSEALNDFTDKQNDAIQTIIQIEAKQFESLMAKGVDSKNLMIYLTNACNMRCPHCYMYADVKKENELSAYEIISFLKCFKNIGGEKVTFSGGEVTTRTDFSEIINKTFGLGYKIEVLTNGTLWTDEMINELAPKISEIQVSIDGYCEEENSRVRGKGNFEKALKTVDEFVNLGVPTRIATTPFFDGDLKNKINNYVNFSKMLIEKYKGKKFEFLFSGEMFDGREISLSDEKREEYKKIMDDIYSKVFPNFENAGFINRHKEHEILNNCLFGNLYISSVGDVYPCSRITSVKPFANLKKDKFTKIIELSKVAMSLSCIDNLKPCNSCELKYICGGGCRLSFFNELANISDFEKIDSLKIKERACTRENKESFYDLMIKTNQEIFNE